MSQDAKQSPLPAGTWVRDLHGEQEVLIPEQAEAYARANMAELLAENERLRAEFEFQAALTKDLLPYQERAVKAEAVVEKLQAEVSTFKRSWIAEKENAERLVRSLREQQELVERLAEALRELEEREQRDEALLRQALGRAHQTAMEQTLKARIPECAEFAGIAQDLDFVVAALRERLGVKA